MTSDTVARPVVVCLILLHPAATAPLPSHPGFPSALPALAAEEVTARIAQLQAARRLLNIQKAMAALHADEDFQGDIAQVGAAVRAAHTLAQAGTVRSSVVPTLPSEQESNAATS